MILTVYLSDGEQAVTEVPITPETTCRDVVEFCKEPGESGCHLAEVWRGNGKSWSERCCLWQRVKSLTRWSAILKRKKKWVSPVMHLKFHDHLAYIINFMKQLPLAVLINVKTNSLLKTESWAGTIRDYTSGGRSRRIHEYGKSSAPSERGKVCISKNTCSHQLLSG